MAQSLVTYLGGAVKASEWLNAAANPASSLHFFDDAFGIGAFTEATAQNGAGYLGGHITTADKANDNGATTTSTAIVAKDPAKLAFACKGRHAANAADGVVGLAAVAAGGAVAPASAVGAYFTTSGGNLTFQVRDSAGVATLALGAAPTVDAEHGFVYQNGKFLVYVDGVLKGEVDRAFPTGDMRFVAGKSKVTTTTTRFMSFDYVLVSGAR
ncbi:MAG: hypothetical protein ACO3SJ_02595 [Phycisphaerales bacterium]